MLFSQAKKRRWQRAPRHLSSGGTRCFLIHPSADPGGVGGIKIDTARTYSGIAYLKHRSRAISLDYISRNKAHTLFSPPSHSILPTPRLERLCRLYWPISGVGDPSLTLHQKFRFSAFLERNWCPQNSQRWYHYPARLSIFLLPRARASVLLFLQGDQVRLLMFPVGGIEQRHVDAPIEPVCEG